MIYRKAEGNYLTRVAGKGLSLKKLIELYLFKKIINGPRNMKKKKIYVGFNLNSNSWCT